jgi:predicted nuclease of restriction endonuclease-like (RecB) superfamily
MKSSNKVHALPVATARQNNAVVESYKELRDAIRKKIRDARYLAASAVNRELLGLYFSVGGLISASVRQKGWGEKVVVNLSNDIQADFPGIRGFSQRNLKNMRRFYDRFSSTEFGQLLTAQINGVTIGQSATARLKNAEKPLPHEFLSVSFTAHILLLQKCRTTEEWCFYIEQAARNQWSIDLLEHHIESKLYEHQGRMQNNFAQNMPGYLRNDAIRAFRDEYLFPFIQVEDPNDEYLIENAIVSNVKKFLLSLGREFAFMGNQYRLVVDDTEYFVDLLFYHRGLRAMVAVELKTGKFKPEYAGKMNFYLAALDEIVKLKDENPSMWIILCREKKKTTVEFAFKFTTAPIGVTTYKLSETLPKTMAKYLPNPEELIGIVESAGGGGK